MESRMVTLMMKSTTLYNIVNIYIYYVFNTVNVSATHSCLSLLAAYLVVNSGEKYPIDSQTPDFKNISFYSAVRKFPLL